ncbi:LamG domain-containing protein, partial [uncultured Oceanicoccus sp.]|uniref:LamG domain-containing protein n=1 Tax=uncultured Oceanicoccus sp. TaxID=1706381 RepID=UPI0030D94368
MPIFSNVLAGAAGQGGAAEYVIPKSLRFNSGDSAHLSRTPTSAGNRRTWTWSAWVKRSKLGERVALFTAGSDNTEILFEPDDVLRIYFYPGSYAGHTKTVASFRDTSAWYHIVVAIDTTQTGNDNIAKIYVNGVQQEVTHPNNWTTNGQTDVNNTVAHYIGSRFGPARLINACMADVQLVDGQALAPTDFGETRSSDGVWVPKEFDGTYGTNGFHLNFSDSSTNEALGF